MSNKKSKEVLKEECCICPDKMFDYNGTTYTVNFDENYCDELEECEYYNSNMKKIAMIGVGVAAASGILFFTLNKKKKNRK